MKNQSKSNLTPEQIVLNNWEGSRENAGTDGILKRMTDSEFIGYATAMLYKDEGNMLHQKGCSGPVSIFELVKKMVAEKKI